jgi:hypothetical protein
MRIVSERGGEATVPSDRWQRIDLGHFAIAATGLALLGLS